MKAARSAVVGRAAPVLGDQHRDAGLLVRVADRAGEGVGVDAGEEPVRRRLPGRVDRAGAVVPVALVVLDADEVVVARQVEPALVDLGPLAVAHRRVVADHDVVDDREADSPTGRSGRRALIAALAATWPAVMPSAIASISSGSITLPSR